MALKQLTILFAIFIFVTADDICACSDDKTEKDIEDFRNFLLNLPTKVDNENKYPVVPGEISPLVPCSNCIEKDRKKRTILERPKHLFKLSPRMNHDESRNRCPLGYRRIAFMCVPS